MAADPGTPTPEASRTAAAGAVQRACFSVAGPQRLENEDACSLPPPGADEARLGVLLALADGVGGLPGGAESSRAAVSYLQALYYASEGPAQPPERLRRCVEAVNALNRLAHHQEGGEEGYLTTLVAAVLLNEQVWVANVGDSRAYLFQSPAGQGFQLTEDHSGRVQILKSGLHGSEEAAQAAGSGITRAIGLTARCQVDIYHYTWSPGDCLVLASDGLASLSPEAMAAIALENPVQEAARLLVQAAARLDGSDNASAVAARWEPSGAAQGFPSRPVSPETSDEMPEEQTGPLSIGPAERQTGAAPVSSGPAPADHPLVQPASRRYLLYALVAGLLLGWVSAIIIIMLLLGTSNVLNLF